MERFLQAIERSIETENWYSAVTLALTIPDICGWLETPDFGSQKRYRLWFDRYQLKSYKNDFFGPDFSFLTSGDAYALRCALVHEGGGSLIRQKAREALSKIAFSTTGSHLIQVENVLMLNVQAFCKETCLAAREWASEMQQRTDVQQRIQELIKVQTGSFSLTPGVFIGR